jgi:hypothetical protein
VKPVVDSGTSRETWSARYERLRAGWCAHELNWGQALFVRQGMAAWMKAWPAIEPPESAMQPDSSGLEPEASSLITLSGELQRHLARELANLILHRQQEVLV